ncbi:MAG TPA: helix-turn-helix domain-containing protein [Puia sp.]|jgi:hypothetical protein
MKELMQRDSKDGAIQQREHSYHLVTVLDLENFRKTLMTDLERLIEGHQNATPKRWLRSYELRKMLNISPGTLQHLKASGIIPFSKVGGSHYYDYQKIQELLAAKDVNAASISDK